MISGDWFADFRGFSLIPFTKHFPNIFTFTVFFMFEITDLKNDRQNESLTLFLSGFLKKQTINYVAALIFFLKSSKTWRLFASEIWLDLEYLKHEIAKLSSFKSCYISQITRSTFVVANKIYYEYQVNYSTTLSPNILHFYNHFDKQLMIISIVTKITKGFTLEIS